MTTERRDADVVVADGTTRGRERVDEIARMGRVGRSAGKGEDGRGAEDARGRREWDVNRREWDVIRAWVKKVSVTK
tara:strand:- start:159 stop:386 length:228 start_codon:yes stop_codon:yes gene_type:complete